MVAAVIDFVANKLTVNQIRSIGIAKAQASSMPALVAIINKSV